MHRLLLIFIPAFLLALNIVAKQPAILPTYPKTHFKGIVKADSSAVVQRSFDEKALNNYKKLKDFDYTEVKGTNLWDRFWTKVWEYISKLFHGEGKQTAGSNKFLGDILMIAACAFIIYALLKMLNLDGLFIRKSKSVTLAYSETTEDINIINFEKDIAGAVSVGNYRLAVRLLYLQSLKLLNDAGLIDWQVSKTNSVYVHEIADSAQKQSFKLLTRQFEYAWYGNLPIDSSSFKNINNLFSDFKGMIK